MEQPELALLADGPPSPRPPSPILQSEGIFDETISVDTIIFCNKFNSDGGAGEGDSSSSGSVLPADAVSAQLINNITMLDYHSLGKTTTLICDSVRIETNIHTSLKY